MIQAPFSEDVFKRRLCYSRVKLITNDDVKTNSESLFVELKTFWGVSWKPWKIYWPVAQGGGFFLLSRTRQIVWEKVDKTTTTKKNCRRKATTPKNTYRKSSIKPPGLIYYPPPGIFISNTFEGEGAYLRRRLIRGFTVCLQTLKEASWTVPFQNPRAKAYRKLWARKWNGSCTRQISRMLQSLALCMGVVRGRW